MVAYENPAPETGYGGGGGGYPTPPYSPPEPPKPKPPAYSFPCILGVICLVFLTVFFGVWAGEEAFWKKHDSPTPAPKPIAGGSVSFTCPNGENVACQAGTQGCSEALMCKDKVNPKPIAGGSVSFTCPNGENVACQAGTQGCSKALMCKDKAKKIVQKVKDNSPKFFPKKKVGSCEGIVDGVLKIDDTSIPEGAYQYCTELVEVDAPEATVIGKNAFGSCYNLKRVNATQVTTIEDVAFAQCYNLETFTGTAVTSIGSSAFFNNYNFKDWAFLATVPDKGTNWNYHKDEPQGANSDCPDTDTVELTDTVIKANTYVGCVGITTLDLPNAETIEAGAFYFNPNIKTVNAPELKIVGDQAFFAAYNMQEFKAKTKGEGLEAERYAFYNTYNLVPPRGITVGKMDPALQ